MLWAPLIWLSTAAAAMAQCNGRLRYVFSFGDSYSSTGFVLSSTKPSLDNPLGNPPFPGKTEDGQPNWVGRLVGELCPKRYLVYNFAVGGATVNTSADRHGFAVPRFVEQVDAFVDFVATKPTYASDWTADNSFAPLWFGINDIDESVWHVASEDDVAAFTDEYQPQLQRLYDAGLRKFLIFTVPPIYRAPFWRTFTPGYRRLVSSLTRAWNRRLRAFVAEFAAAHADGLFTLVDVGPTFDVVLDNPHEHGAPNASCSGANTTCLWANDGHPGAALHEAVAQLAREATVGWLRPRGTWAVLGYGGGGLLVVASFLGMRMLL